MDIEALQRHLDLSRVDAFSTGNIEIQSQHLALQTQVLILKQLTRIADALENNIDAIDAFNLK